MVTQELSPEEMKVLSWRGRICNVHVDINRSRVVSEWVIRQLGTGSLVWVEIAILYI